MAAPNPSLSRNAACVDAASADPGPGASVERPLLLGDDEAGAARRRRGRLPAAALRRQPLHGADSRMVSAPGVCHDRRHVNVLIVDDHPSFRANARALLEAEGFEIVGEAADGASALLAAAELHPQLVLLDVQLPDIDGFEVATRLTSGAHPPAVVLVSSRDGCDFGPLVERSGARGFIPKAELSGAALSALLG
jgi:CheY-like chemotaxis protein